MERREGGSPPSGEAVGRGGWGTSEGRGGAGEVLMMAWMSPESLQLSLAEGRTVFWSRSRRELWRKGDTSGDRQWIRSAWYDCDEIGRAHV